MLCHFLWWSRPQFTKAALTLPPLPLRTRERAATGESGRLSFHLLLPQWHSLLDSSSWKREELADAADVVSVLNLMVFQM
ncbi:hypothetical protein ATANTOWER_020142 [Ataeniobius toweri]|uniref:Uncharacterized protein n=1 Tax=Ataeniobius toweri TaxID=208326 RepID=A0ABU7BIB8_9TELE|nr:hypothetical protein [Ataeniobius toweri]